jgi:hypothetical protein
MVILMGILIYQYFYNRSLWMDEAMLSVNIVERNFPGLLKPLEYGQVAPILFLLIEKAFTLVLGNTELGLRFFPLLCSIASLLLFYYLVLSLTNNKYIALVALCLFGVSSRFIYFSSEVKQYAIDLFVLLAIYAIVFINNKWMNKHRPVILSVTGGLAVFLSNVAVIPLFITGVWIMYQAFREKNFHRLVPLVVWGVCFGINYFLFIHNHPYRQAMVAFWQSAFMPLNNLHAFGTWMLSRGNQVFSDLLPVPAWEKLFVVTILLYVAGIVYWVINKRFLVVYVCVAPVLLHLLLSGLKLYPFELRLILYQLPLYLFMVASGLFALLSFALKKKVLLYIALSVFIVAYAIPLYDDYPWKREEIKPVLRNINKHIQPGQPVYVYYGSQAVLRYYTDIGVARFGNAPIIYGGKHRGNENAYLDELQHVKGPVWLLFSHIYPMDDDEGDEANFILRRLRQRGRVLKEFHAYDASAYLFELK